MNPLSLLEGIHGSVVVVGSMNVDYTVATERLPQPGETVSGGTLQLLPGGKSGNQASASALLGANVVLLGAVGNDDNGNFLLSNLEKSGVTTSQIRHVEAASGTTVITVDSNGENTIVYSAGANAHVDVSYICSHAALISQYPVLGLCLESPIESVCAAAQIAHNAGTKVLLNNSPFSNSLPSDLIENCDILLVNEHEMAQLLNLNEPADGDWLHEDWNIISQHFERFGFQQAIVTLGGQGSVVLDCGSVHMIKPVRVPVVDTTGCGDAFMGTVLAGLSSGYELAQSCSLASYVSAFAAMGHGAQASYGSAAQIRDYFLE